MPEDWIPPDPGPESHSVTTYLRISFLLPRFTDLNCSSWLDAIVDTSESDYLALIYSAYQWRILYYAHSNLSGNRRQHRHGQCSSIHQFYTSWYVSCHFTSGMSSTHRLSDPRQNPSTSLPATLFSDLHIDDEQYRSAHQQLWGVQHASGIPVSSNTPNGDQHAGGAMLPSDRFGQSSSLYAPPTYQTHTHYPSAIQEPQLDRLPFRRRGPNINSIERRRERAPSFFCDFRGCNNVGFTTRASLNRKGNLALVFGCKSDLHL